MREAKLRIVCFSLLFLVSCMSEREAQVKKTVQDELAVFTFDRLFEEIIGRKLGNDVVVDPNRSIVVDGKLQKKNDMHLIDNWFDQRDKINKGNISAEQKQAAHRFLNTLFYENAVDLILNSPQYLDEGFLHLHKRRLLLFYQGESTLMQNALTDYLSLQAEMRDVAAADNYWQLFTYRDRYLPISGSSIRGLPISSCLDREYTDDGNMKTMLSDNESCLQFLLASFLPDYQHRGTCYGAANSQVDQPRKFSQVYYERCGDGSIEDKDKDFCDAIHTSYQELLGKNYPDIAHATVDNDICSASDDNNPDTLLSKAKENFLELIYFYVSLYLSEGAKDFVTASQPAGDRQSLLSAVDGSTVFLKTTLPPAMQGIHANPFWLSQHRTTTSNMGLHRARLLLYSWFCEYISPDAASLGGGTVASNDPEKIKLNDYFAQGDIHTFSDRNCFDCHKRVQPLANYFGKLSLGVPYHDRIEFDRYFFPQRLLAMQASFDRPAGYYDIAKKEFFSKGKGYGMSALAELLQEHPQVRQCVVESTWNSIFGGNNALNSSEVETAITKFVENNFSYKRLLKHLLLSKKARAFFLEGQEALTKIIAAEQSDCEDAQKDAQGNLHGKTAQDIFAKTCASSSCHADGMRQTNPPFLNNTNQFIVGSNATVYNEVYNRVSWGQGALRGTKNGMPMMPYLTDSGFPSKEKQKQLLLCFLREEAEKKNYMLKELEATDDAATAIKNPLPSNHQGGTQQ